jgi:protein gp37
VQWIVQGGESGKGARPFDYTWARSMRDQCQAAGVSYWFKQWGDSCARPAEDGIEEQPATLYGKTYHQLPAGLRLPGETGE